MEVSASDGRLGAWVPVALDGVPSVGGVGVVVVGRGEVGWDPTTGMAWIA